MVFEVPRASSVEAKTTLTTIRVEPADEDGGAFYIRGICERYEYIDTRL